MGNSNEFASKNLTIGQLNAVVKKLKKLGGEEGVERFLRGELQVSETPRSWREEDGVIYFSVTSDGTTGEDWITRLESKDPRASSDYAKQVLCSPYFKPTNGVTTEVALLKHTLFSREDRVTDKIHAEANKRKLEKPNAEVACLIFEKFTNKNIDDMGLEYITPMHEYIRDFDGDSRLLLVERVASGILLNATRNSYGSIWRSEGGFAFAVSQSK